jgi:NAD-dependent deacetylase
MTSAQPDAEILSQFVALVAQARRVLAFTGAGISTASGVPDFRSPGSPWMVNKPIPYQAFVASADVRREAWRRKFAMDDHYRGARPNVAHEALAHLVRSGRSHGIITQNIDGLHQASGVASEDIVELHGNGTYAACLDCGRRHELDWVRPHVEATGHAPACVDCAGLIKSATVSFGQAMPAEAMRRAQELTLAADVFLAIGSSLVVYPAAAFPVMARRNGARLIIINGEPTPLDDEADLVVRGEIAKVLQPLLAL